MARWMHHRLCSACHLSSIHLSLFFFPIDDEAICSCCKTSCWPSLIPHVFPSIHIIPAPWQAFCLFYIPLKLHHSVRWQKTARLQVKHTHETAEQRVMRKSIRLAVKFLRALGSDFIVVVLARYSMLKLKVGKLERVLQSLCIQTCIIYYSLLYLYILVMVEECVYIVVWEKVCGKKWRRWCTHSSEKISGMECWTIHAWSLFCLVAKKWADQAKFTWGHDGDWGHAGQNR